MPGLGAVDYRSKREKVARAAVQEGKNAKAQSKLAKQQAKLIKAKRKAMKGN